jgi:hypothetical protein
MAVVKHGLLLIVALAALALVASCENTSKRQPVRWSGPPSPTIESFYDRVQCRAYDAMAASLIRNKLPTALVVDDGKIRRIFPGSSVSSPPSTIGAHLTDYTQGARRLWLWSFPNDPETEYYIAELGEGRDPILYGPACSE